jgi:hypothetical protein
VGVCWKKNLDCGISFFYYLNTGSLFILLPSKRDF